MNDNVEQNSLKHYACGDCYTSFSAIGNVTNCPYCGGSRLGAGDADAKKKISYVPFAYTLKDAYSVFKKKFRSPLIPFSFHSGKIKKMIKKVYIPCTLYNFIVEGNASFLGMDKVSNVQGAPAQTFETMYQTHFDFKNLLMSHYSRISDEVLSNVNDYEFYAQDGTLSMIEDASLFDSDVDTKKSFNVVQQKLVNYCLNVVRGNVEHERKKLDKNNMKISVTGKSEIYVPIYLLNMKCDGKETLFIVNGQTGEMLGEPPISIGSIIIFSIIVFLIIFGIASLIAYFL